MTSIGADPDALERLARALSGASSELQQLTRRTDAAIARSSWDGPDGARFRRSWTAAHRPRLLECASRCRALSRQASLNASEQRRASASTGAPTAAGRLSPLGDSTVHRGELTGSIGPLSAALAGTLTITEVGDRRRVTYVDEVRGGVGASAGRGVTGHVGPLGASSGAVAGTGGSLENTVRRTWVVDADDVAGLLVALAIEQGATHVPGGLESRAGAQAVRVIDALGGLVGVDLPDALIGLGDGPAVGSGLLPDPVRTEDLLGVNLSGEAWAALAVSGAGAVGVSGAGLTEGGGSASAAVRVGTATNGRHRSLVLEAEGDAAIRIRGAVPSTDRGTAAAASVRIEVPIDDDRPMLVTSTSGESEREVTRLAVDPTVGAEALRTARRALERIIGGDPAGGFADLDRLSLPDGSFHLEQSVERITASDADFGTSTPMASIGFDGAVEHHTIAP